MTTRQRLETLERTARRSRPWEPDPEGGRLVLTGDAAAAVLCWWEAHGAAPTGGDPLAVLQVREVACSP